MLEVYVWVYCVFVWCLQNELFHDVISSLQRFSIFGLQPSSFAVNLDYSIYNISTDLQFEEEYDKYVGLFPMS